LITAGVAGAVGIFFTWRGQRQAREDQEENQQTTQAQLNNAQEELTLTRQGQITERFTKAIDQLGATNNEGKNKKLEIRLGGIYALDRIARESEGDYRPIMEILTAYVRQNAPLRTEKESTEAGSDDGASAPDPDVQAIMTVLRRRTRSFGHGEPEPLDLHETNLVGANLAGADLTKADLPGAVLTYAVLTKADLTQADLSEATLLRANLWGATLTGALLPSANLAGAFLSADLSWANLTLADLRGAELGGADLRRAGLGGAKLREASLGGADLRGADPTQKQLDEATGNKNTQLPHGLVLPAHWEGRTDKQIEGDCSGEPTS
jgi:uncharacterized protein YjbI with pentapeptide repeats